MPPEKPRTRTSEKKTVEIEGDAARRRISARRAVVVAGETAGRGARPGPDR